MNLELLAPYGSRATDAFEWASRRGILPSWMGTAELAELVARVQDRAVFSARTTHAVYLQTLKDAIDRLVEGDYKGDEATLRLELKQKLAEIGYDPERGFPGDEALGVPPARPGSLQDLSSDRRINLILRTQMELAGGRGQKLRGLSGGALKAFPAWELVRSIPVRVPRAWAERWQAVGGPLRKDADGRTRLMALKTDEIWARLGDRAEFADALNTDHPPFAFNSGMRWRAVPASLWREITGQAAPDQSQAVAEVAPTLGETRVSTAKLSPEIRARLAAKLKAIEEGEALVAR